MFYVNVEYTSRAFWSLPSLPWYAGHPAPRWYISCNAMQ